MNSEKKIKKIKRIRKPKANFNETSEDKENYDISQPDKNENDNEVEMQNTQNVEEKNMDFPRVNNLNKDDPNKCSVQNKDEKSKIVSSNIDIRQNQTKEEEIEVHDQKLTEKEISDNIPQHQQQQFENLKQQEIIPSNREDELYSGKLEQEIDYSKRQSVKSNQKVESTSELNNNVKYPEQEQNSDKNKSLEEIKISRHHSTSKNLKDEMPLSTSEKFSSDKYIYLNNQEFSSEKSLSDDDSIESRKNSIHEFFSSTRQDNAKRLQSQIVDIQTNALCYSKTLIKLGNDFDKMKKRLNSTTNNIFNYLFSLFGYTYRSNFQNANLFIFSSQAWLICLGNILDNKIKKFSNEEKQNFKFSNLFEIIRNEMQTVTSDMEETFLNNLGIFTGNLLLDRTHSSTRTLIENNIGASFMKLLAESIKTDHDLNAKTDIDNKQFEDILMNLLRKSVEETLNIKISEEGNEYIDFIHLFDELKCKMLMKSNIAKEIKITFDDYFEYVINSEKFKRKNLSDLKLNQIKICAEAFYIFSQARIDEIIIDARLFIRNYSSIVYKTKLFVDQSVSRCLNFTKRAKTIYLKLSQMASNPIPFDKISLTCYNASRSVLKNCASVVKSSERNVSSLKNWVKDSYHNLRRYKPIFYFSNITSDLIKYGLEVPEIIFEIFVEKCKYGIEGFKTLKNNIQDFIIKINEHFKNKFNFATLKLMKFVYLKEEMSESGERLVIVFNRRLMDYSPVLFVKIYEKIRNIIKNSNKIINKNLKSLKMSLITRYKKLLNINQEEVNEINVKSEFKVNDSYPHKSSDEKGMIKMN